MTKLLATAASVTDFSGIPAIDAFPCSTVTSPGSASSITGRHGDKSLTEVPRRERRGRPARDNTPTRSVSKAEGTDVRIALHDVDVLDGDAQLLGDDLGQSGVVAAARRCHSRQDGDLTRGVDSHRR